MPKFSRSRFHVEHARTGSVRLLVLLLSIVPLIGCGAYTLEGRAVVGAYSGIELVDPDDPRLSGTGSAGMTVEIVRDPESLSRRIASRATSDGTGAIRLVISDFGAGFLEEDWELRVLRSGSEFAADRITLPFNPGDKRILVTVRPGDGRSRNSLSTESERLLGGEDSRIPSDSTIFR